MSATNGKEVWPSMQETRSTEGETRRQVMLYVLKNGPVTAADIAHELGLSAAGVRRHLDILVDTGYAETVKPRAGAAGSGRAYRGRPAKHFRLTETGRTQFGHSYDKLASDALHAIRQAGGSAAVERFATAHWNRLLAGVDLDADVQAGDEESLSDAVRKLADVLDAHGFAATVTNAGRGVQICQHHCPVARVAAEHPELCAAEQEVVSAKLGTHVQPLATIADGHGICTTNIPLNTASTPTTQEDDSHERSGS